jgi:hypothetical protein
MNDPPTDGLPVKHSLKLWYLSSSLIGLLTAVAALAGLVVTDDIYPTEELRRAFLANDAVTLAIGLPILLGSMWLTRRGQLAGLLFWPGAILFGLYNYLVYLFGMSLNWMFPLYLLIVTLSLYTTIGLLVAIDGQAVKGRLAGRVPERLGGGFLALLSFGFLTLAIVEIVRAIAGQSAMSRPDLGLRTADFIAGAAWVIGGVLQWRKQPLGYVAGPALLFQTSNLFIGVIVIVILGPLLFDAPFVLADLVVLSIMSVFALVPLALYLRGLTRE